MADSASKNWVMEGDLKSSDTKDRLLEKAETLFAQKGYHGVSVREITAAARCDMGAVNYHFGSKKTVHGGFSFPVDTQGIEYV